MPTWKGDRDKLRSRCISEQFGNKLWERAANHERREKDLRQRRTHSGQLNSTEQATSPINNGPGKIERSRIPANHRLPKTPLVPQTATRNNLA